MYQQFFGFKSLPFKITPDERVFFAGAHRQEMLDALLYSIERGEGIITVIGEVGIGKTTLARVLSNRFSDCFAIISIFTPNVSPLDMLRLIAQEAQLNPPASAGKVELMQLIRAYCLDLHQQGKRFLLLVDEAQTMLIETIEELRLLSNMQVDDVKLVQVLLFGQPELDRMLNSPELRQVKDRVVFQIHIEPFSRDELADYLAFRLQQAGYQGQHFFSTAVVDAIYRKSQGYARAVNRLADQALMAAFAEQTHQVLLSHVESSNQEAIQPLVSDETKVQTPQLWLLMGASLFKSKRVLTVVVTVLLLLGILGWLTDFFSFTPSAQIMQSTHSVIDQAESRVQPKVVDSASSTPIPEPAAAPLALVAPTTSQSSEAASGIQPELPSLPAILANSNNEQWLRLHQAQLTLFRQYAQQDKFTIQLMSSPWRLRTPFVEEVSVMLTKLPKEPSFYYDYSMTADRPRIAAIYGIYDNKELAQQALKALNAMNKGYRPEMTSFKQVLAMMQASQVLGVNP